MEFADGAADERVEITRTVRAYERLIAGETDLIFAAQPSPAQRQRAAERGVELDLTPVAREAFVFIVRPDNPVRGLTLEQIRAIYSGRTTDWRELGGAPGRIIAFQRPADSGSQTVMQARVMQGKPMSAPLAEERVRGMGGLVRQVAAYRDTAQSIGYTFRYYATQMHGDVTLRLLAIDGVEPRIDTIRDGSYPLTVDVYMVTRQDPPAPVRQLMAWFLSPRGQRLIEDVGCVPLK
jgi:phosphate transport system substrate-binding protein